ncbi:MAG TPA: hypothetical protein VH479_20835 [Acidimicrobiales bacterium]
MTVCAHVAELTGLLVDGLADSAGRTSPEPAPGTPSPARAPGLGDRARALWRTLRRLAA